MEHYGNNEVKLKTFRILSMFERLSRGAVLKKREEATRYNVNEKTVQRDLDDLRAYLAETYPEMLDLNLVYRRDKGGYVLIRDEQVWLTREEVLTISKVLLESRAFQRTEMNTLLSKLTSQTEPRDRQLIQDIIRNNCFTMYLYQNGCRDNCKHRYRSSHTRTRRILNLNFTNQRSISSGI